MFRYVNKRLSEVKITGDLKKQIEHEVIDKFINRARVEANVPKPKVNKQQDSRPRMPDHHDVVDNMSQLSVNEVPQDLEQKPQDIYSIITRMNASLEQEDEAKKKIKSKNRQQL